MIEQKILEVLERMEAQGLRGIAFRDGCFRVVVTEEQPKEPHHQMFHISIKETPE